MPPKRKRRGDDNDEHSHDGDKDNDGDMPEPQTKRAAKFAMLKPRVRHVGEDTIKSKWTTLPDSAQDKVKELFLSVELPVISRHRDERKRTEVQSALATVRKNLGKRLPRMPFPPNTRDVSFDYESALHENRALESQLTTTTDSIGLLEAEIKREEAELARDMSKLQELETNAKAAKTERKRLSKNVHPVLKRLDDPFVKQQSSPVDLEVPEIKDETAMLCDSGTDSDLYPVIKQLRSHLESMQSNATQVNGIGDAISCTESSLDWLPLG